MLAPSTINRIDAEKTGVDQIRRIKASLQLLHRMAGLSVYIRSVEGIVTLIMGERQSECGAPIPEVDWSRPGKGMVFIALETGGTLLIHDNTPDQLCLRPAEAIVRATLSLFEVEKREERLLEELSASWESLEAHYEISTDALRSVNIDETLKRLLDRLVSMHSGLHGTLFVDRESLFLPLVSTETHGQAIALEQLGHLERVIRERQTIAVTHVPDVDGADVCWRNARVVAATPVTSRQDTIGFLAVWCEEPDFEFDSAFLRLLEAIAYQASILMERDRMNRQLRDSELLAKEIEIASSIQQTLLLANTPKDVPGIEIAACSLPSQYIDGDFYDFFQHPDGTLDVIVGDVMGKGVAAALLGAATKSQVLRSLANLALRATSGAPLPVDIVRRAASRIGDQLISLDRFVTMCYARFDTKARMLHLVDCGHTSTILSRKAKECVFLRSDDLPLGVLQPYECTQHSFPFRQGDTYLFYSDGVTESRSAEGEFFGADRLAECVEHWSSLGPALLVEQIRKEAQQFSGSQKFSDDFTCIAIRIKIGFEASQSLFSATATFPAEADELSRFRNWLRSSVGVVDPCLGEEETARMELACSELFVNCAKHKHPIPSSEFIRLETQRCQDHATVRMMHKGPVFDPLSVVPPTFDGSRDDGFGTYIVLRSADEAKYERDAEGTNVITVSFLRSDRSSSNAIAN